MTIDVGRVGIWSTARAWGDEAADAAGELDQLGYGTLWFGSLAGDLGLVETALAATRRIVVATGVANVWMTEPEPVAAFTHRMNEAYPGRFLLGIGSSSAPAAEAVGRRYERPLAHLARYADGLDAAQVGLAAEETERLLRATWRERVELRGGMVRLDATPAGPRRYQADAGGRPLGWGKGCSVDMYLLALALGRPVHAEATCPATGTPITVDITPERVERIDPPTAVVAVVDWDVDLTLGPDRTDAEVCAQQPFFASPQAASRWLAEHPQGRLIPVRSFHDEARRLVAWLEGTPAPGSPSSEHGGAMTAP